MSVSRSLVLAQVIRVKDTSNLCYPSCTQCYSKVFLENHTWECVRCNRSYTVDTLAQRYRLTLVVYDGATQCDVTIFGKTLEPFFGSSANELLEYLNAVDRKQEEFSNFDSGHLLQAATESVFEGQMFVFGFKGGTLGVRNQGQTTLAKVIKNFHSSHNESTFYRISSQRSTNNITAYQIIQPEGIAPENTVLKLLKDHFQETSERSFKETASFNATVGRYCYETSVLGNSAVSVSGSMPTPLLSCEKHASFLGWKNRSLHQSYIAHMQSTSLLSCDKTQIEENCKSGMDIYMKHLPSHQGTGMRFSSQNKQTVTDIAKPCDISRKSDALQLDTSQCIDRDNHGGGAVCCENLQGDSIEVRRGASRTDSGVNIEGIDFDETFDPNTQEDISMPQILSQESIVERNASCHRISWCNIGSQNELPEEKETLKVDTENASQDRRVLLENVEEIGDEEEIDEEVSEILLDHFEDFVCDDLQYQMQVSLGVNKEQREENGKKTDVINRRNDDECRKREVIKGMRDNKPNTIPEEESDVLEKEVDLDDNSIINSDRCERNSEPSESQQQVLIDAPYSEDLDAFIDGMMEDMTVESEVTNMAICGDNKSDTTKLTDQSTDNCDKHKRKNTKVPVDRSRNEKEFIEDLDIDRSKNIDVAKDSDIDRSRENDVTKHSDIDMLRNNDIDMPFSEDLDAFLYEMAEDMNESEFYTDDQDTKLKNGTDADKKVTNSSCHLSTTMMLSMKNDMVANTDAINYSIIITKSDLHTKTVTDTKTYPSTQTYKDPKSVKVETSNKTSSSETNIQSDVVGNINIVTENDTVMKISLKTLLNDSKGDACPEGHPDNGDAHPEGHPDKGDARPEGHPDKDDVHHGGHPDKDDGHPKWHPDEGDGRHGGQPDKCDARPEGHSDKGDARPEGHPDKDDVRHGGQPDKDDGHPKWHPDKGDGRHGGQPDKDDALPEGHPDKGDARPEGHLVKGDGPSEGHLDKSENPSEIVEYEKQNYCDGSTDLFSNSISEIEESMDCDSQIAGDDSTRRKSVHFPHHLQNSETIEQIDEQMRVTPRAPLRRRSLWPPCIKATNMNRTLGMSNPTLCKMSPVVLQTASMLHCSSQELFTPSPELIINLRNDKSRLVFSQRNVTFQSTPVLNEAQNRSPKVVTPSMSNFSADLFCDSPENQSLFAVNSNNMSENKENISLDLFHSRDLFSQSELKTESLFSEGDWTDQKSRSIMEDIIPGSDHKTPKRGKKSVGLLRENSMNKATVDHSKKDCNNLAANSEDLFSDTSWEEDICKKLF